MTRREARQMLGSRTVRRRNTKTYAINYNGKGGKAIKARYPRPAVASVARRVELLLQKDAQ